MALNGIGWHYTIEGKALFSRLIALLVGIFTISTTPLFAYAFHVHQNLPEDAFLFMEFQGTNQMRWAANYLVAKAEGRYTGLCVALGGSASGDSLNIQCGAIGMNRVGADKMDYVQDVFIEHPILPFSWNAVGQNVTSYTHFINLKKYNAAGNNLEISNYNTFDGYGYNGTYGYGETFGLDSLLAFGLNASSFSIDPVGCTHSACAEYLGLSFALKENPAVDYMQNNSTTVLGNPSTSKRLGNDPLSNYNCLSDTILIGPCNDEGIKVDGIYQIPNVKRMTDLLEIAGSVFVGDQDWITWEPGYNAGTFYFNEAWLEGLQSRNHSLQTGVVVNRYYTVSGDQVLYYTPNHHYLGDFAQMTHVWVSTGYNHTDIEGWAEDQYGKRKVGEAVGGQNYEDYTNTQAYANSRQNRYNLPIGDAYKILFEQAFLTYHIRYRAGYDKMTTNNHAVWDRLFTWASQNVHASMALLNEKAVMDLRRCRNSGSCNNI
ncbi:MAG: hypothetical protein LDLANPLL_00601 [Turneriella sp.]|nr:hypothetical protein [Turneriella sp.]